MIRCQSCGHENQPIFRFCLRCGSELGEIEAAAKPKPSPPTKGRGRSSDCPHCGAAPTAGRRFCLDCGREAVPPGPDEGPRNRVGQLVLIQPDGSDGPVRPLFDGATSIGSVSGDHVFPEDELMSAHHADIVVEKGETRIYDRDSTCGTFVRIQEAMPLEDGSQFRVGQQLLEVSLGPGKGEVWGKVVRVARSFDDKQSYTLEGENVFIGRERGHIVFPEDGYVSGSHAVLFRQDGELMLKDLDSSNGTYVRTHRGQLSGATPFVLIGAQLFRIELD